MKLFFSPGACSLSPHIALKESGLPFEAVKVDTKAGKTAAGEDFKSINSKGAVPALQMADGQVLTEGAAIVQYIADQKPESGLAPKAGTLERYRLMEALNYVATELHKTYSILFNPKNSDEVKAATRAALLKKYEWLQQQLDGKQYLLGDKFTVADGYLFTVSRWAKNTGLDLSGLPGIQAYLERVGSRPAVKAAMQAEGLS
jgi:glutathione S-transferase